MELNLSQKQLRTFDDVWPYIKAPRDITSLSLRQNRLQDLPKSLARFTYLKKLDLSANPIKQIDFIIDGLVSLPKLKELVIDNLSESGLALLRSRLPKLELVNGVILKSYIHSKVGKIDKLERKESRKESSGDAKPLPGDLNYLKLAFDCLDTLYGEKGEKRSALKSLDEKVQERLMQMGAELDPRASAEHLHACSLKIESDVNFYVLNALAGYVRSYGDERIATLIDFITERNRTVSDTLFSIAKAKEALANSTRRLRQDSSNLRQKLNDVSAELINQKSQNIAQYAEPIKSESIMPVEPKPYRIIKPMTRSNLKELMRELFDAKRKADKSSLESGTPLRTLKDFLYDMLVKKFGLPNLVEETVESLILGVEAHMSSDVDVFIFKQMIENRLHEQFYSTLHKIRKSLRKTLYSFVRAKCKTTTKGSFESAYDFVLKNAINLKEAQLLLFLLYNENDAVELSELVADNASVVPSELPAVRMLVVPVNRQYEIKWTNFEEIVLRYIVARQLKFVHNFVCIFRDADENGTGVINESDFRAIVNKISSVVRVQIDTDELLVKMDPGNAKFVVFSQCLALLASLYTQDAETGEELSVLALLNARANSIV